MAEGWLKGRRWEDYELPTQEKTNGKKPAKELQWFDSDPGIATFAADHYQVFDINYPTPLERTAELIRRMELAGAEIPEQLATRHKHLLEASA
jgi:hypothetical protein